VDVTEAVPEEVAAGRSHEQRALADADRGLRTNANEPRLELAQLDAVALCSELVERRPGLATLAHVLSLVLADRATHGHRRAGRLLHPAGEADVCGRAHAARRSSSSSRRTRSSRSASLAFSFATTFAGAFSAKPGRASRSRERRSVCFASVSSFSRRARCSA